MVWKKGKAILGQNLEILHFHMHIFFLARVKVQPPRKEDVGFKMLLLQSREKSFLSVAGILITQWTISFTVIFNFILISRKHQYSTSPLILVYSIQSYSRVQRYHKMMFVSIIWGQPRQASAGRAGVAGTVGSVSISKQSRPIYHSFIVVVMLISGTFFLLSGILKWLTRRELRSPCRGTVWIFACGCGFVWWLIYFEW